VRFFRFIAWVFLACRLLVGLDVPAAAAQPLVQNMDIPNGSGRILVLHEV